MSRAAIIAGFLSLLGFMMVYPYNHPFWLEIGLLATTVITVAFVVDQSVKFVRKIFGRYSNFQ